MFAWAREELRAFVESTELVKVLVFGFFKAAVSNVLCSLIYLVRDHAPIRQFSASTLHINPSSSISMKCQGAAVIMRLGAGRAEPSYH